MKLQEKSSLHLKTRNYESTMLPSYRASVNEEIDEGDITKGPIYNQLTKNDQGNSRHTCGNRNKINMLTM